MTRGTVRIERERLLTSLGTQPVMIVAAGSGLGKSVLLDHHRQRVQGRGEAAVLIHLASDQSVLAGFLRTLTVEIMRQTGQRVFEGEISVYANAGSELPPETFAYLVAKDLERFGGPLYLLLDQLQPSAELSRFLGEFRRRLPDRVHLVCSGFEPLTFTLGWMDVPVIGPAELRFTRAEAAVFGTDDEWYHASQGVAALLALGTIGPRALDQYLTQRVWVVRGLRDGERLLAAGLLDTWSRDTPPAVCRALGLPDDYLAQYQAAGWPLASTEHVTPPDPLLARLKTILQEEGRLAPLGQQLVQVYGEREPLRALGTLNALQVFLGVPTPLDQQLDLARVHLKIWAETKQWLTIRQFLQDGVIQTRRGTELRLLAHEVLLLARALYETAASLDDFRLALDVIRAGETQLMLRQPELGQIKGAILVRLGRLSHARRVYEELLPYIADVPALADDVRGHLTLCLLGMGEPKLAQYVLGDAAATLGRVCQVTEVLTLLALGRPEDARRGAQAVLNAWDVGDLDAQPAVRLAWIAGLLDLGLLEEAQRWLGPPPDASSADRWVQAEYRRLHATLLFRRHQFLAALEQGQSAIVGMTHLSDYGQQPEHEFHDVYSLVQSLVRQFLTAIMLHRHDVAEQQLTQLAVFARGERSLERAAQRCRAVMAACLSGRGRIQDTPLLQGDHSELTLVLELCLGLSDARRAAYPTAMHLPWRNWSPLGPAVHPPESWITELPLDLGPSAPRYGLTLRTLGQPFSLTAQGQPVTLPLRAFVLLALLSVRPRTSAELCETLFSFSSKPRNYLRVTVSRLKETAGRSASTPWIVFDRECDTYRLHPELEVDSDLAKLYVVPVEQLPQVYAGALESTEPWMAPFYSAQQVRRDLLARLSAPSPANARVLRLLIERDPELARLDSAARAPDPVLGAAP